MKIGSGLIAAMLCLLATSVVAQSIPAGSADGAILRGLDKVSGEVRDIALKSGATAKLGNLNVTLGECRFPLANPAGDAYAYLEVTSDLSQDTVFAGWMIASSPALNPLDHARFDVWVLRCAMAETSGQ